MDDLKVSALTPDGPRQQNSESLERVQIPFVEILMRTPDPAQAEVLREGVESWNRWREQNRSEPVNLRRVSLNGLDLRGVDLSAPDFRGADLRQVSLENADLTEANLRGADLRGAKLAGATLVDANLQSSDLGQTRLMGANLEGANLTQAMLRHTDFTSANLRGATFGGTVFSYPKIAGADLEGALFRGPCMLDPDTVARSDGVYPHAFLRGAGWPERLVEYWPDIHAQGIRFYSAFISYSRQDPDRSFAIRLHDQLQGRRFNVWRDDHEIVPGDGIMSEIDRGIRLWDKTLLCCSEASLKSWWVQREIEVSLRKERALYAERGEPVLCLVPLNLDGYLLDGWDHPYATHIRERLAADFNGWEKSNAVFEAQFERVVRAMTVGGGKAPPPVSQL